MKNFKKVISVVMALAMIISSFTAVSAASFADVADTAPYAEAVQVLKALGVANGVEQENGTFNFEPEKTVTRAEAVTLIVGALNLADDAKAAAATSQFGDVNSQAAWAAGFVNVGVAQGFIAGYDANSFGPLDNVTYAQLCVMLTKITGYGEYAQAYGGWPTGYTTMAATAGINEGVAVASDAALTKGQVAMMIWNALQAPMLGVETYAINGNEYKPLDGTDGKFKTLFSEKFDGYVATVKIVETPALGDLENDEVKFDLVKTDWWPLEKAKYPSKDLEEGDVDTVDATLAADVNVNDCLLQQGKAVYLLDEDDEIEVIYFKAAGKTAAKEIAADTYYLQDNLVAEKQYSADNLKIRFGSTYHKFADSIDVYVNGNEWTTLTPATENVNDKLDWLLGNAKGTIKLVKNDNDDYNTIFVNFYQVAEVISVDIEDDETVLTLAGPQCLLGDTEVDEIVLTAEEIEEGKTVVTVTRNGEAATLASLVNGDIIAYAVDFDAIEDDKIIDPKTIDIIATNDTLSGSITAIDANLAGTNDNVYTIGGADYTLVPDAEGDADDEGLTLKAIVDLRLDPFGRIYDKEVNATAAEYGIALRVDNDDKLKILLADGTTKTYEVDSAKADIYDSDFIDDINSKSTPVEDRVVKFEVSGKNGKIIVLDLATGSDFEKEYKSRTSLLGAGNKILDTTPIVYVEDNDIEIRDASKYTAMSKDDLLDGTVYTGIAYKVNTTVAFVVLTNIGTSFGEDSRFAVAIDEPAEILTEEGDRVMSVKVLYNGEKQDLLFTPAAAEDVEPGTIFFFETDSDGYVCDIYAAPFGEDTLAGLIDADEWSYNIWDEDTSIQLATGVVVDVTSSSVTFATVDQIEAGVLDTTLDLEDEIKSDSKNGIVSYSIADECAVYTYDVNKSTKIEADKYDVATSISSVKASNFASFDKTADEASGKLNDGVYAGDLESKANVATVMIVDGEIVAIFVAEM